MSQTVANVNSYIRCSNSIIKDTHFLLNLQGCTMRCLHCTNPELRSCNVNKKMSISDIMSEISQVEENIRTGGVVVSGGEPLIQIDFLIEFFKVLKQKKIKTSIYTSGILFDKARMPKFNALMEYTDTVILNIKHIDNEVHKKLTGHMNHSVLNFAKYLSVNKIPLRIIYIAIPNVNTNTKHIKMLGEFLSELENIVALDVIPFKNVSDTYKNLKMKYMLEDIPTATSDFAQDIKKQILDVMRSCKTNSLN